ERRRISLGMKQCQPNPWENFAATHNKGDHVTGTIKSITDFGVFIGLDGGIDGLVHLSDISWHETGEEAIRKYSKGDELETVVLSVDAERERISLGVKQLERDPFSSFAAEYNKGALINAKVLEVDAKGAVMELAEGVDGYLKASEISLDKRVDDASKEISVGDEIEVKIINIDRKKRSISLSIKAKEQDDESTAVQEYAPDQGTGAKLGDILREHLENK
ncbi:MAG: S1 RNA-binding domain-containing protein, partial [Gammaproteobacteria bacterium]